MHKKTDQVHIGDHFCLSLTMQGHLQTAATEHYTPQMCTGGIVFVLSMYIMNRKGERAHPFHSPTLTLKGFVFMPLTQTLTFHCLYNDLIAANS